MLLTIFLVFLACFIIYGLNPVWRWRVRHIPGLKPHFLLGNLPEIAKEPTAGDVVDKNRRKFGNVMKVWFGRTPVIYLSDPEDCKKVFTSGFKDFPGRGLDVLVPRPLPKDAGELDTLSVFEATGSLWKTLRPHWSHYLSNTKSLGHFTSLMQTSIEKMCTFFRASAGKCINVVPSVRTLTMEVVGTTSFGVSFSDEEGNALESGGNSELVAAGSHVIQSLGAGDLFTVLNMILPVLYPLLRLLAPLIARPTIQARRLIRNRTFALVRDVREKRKGSAAAGPGSDLMAGSFLSNLANVTDKTSSSGQALDEKVIAAQAFIMLLAGFETTANSLACALWLLAAQPKVQDRLIEEVDAQARAGNVGPGMDLSKFTYLNAFVNEVLRLYNPAGWIARECVSACEIGGHKIEPGFIVAACIYSVHRNTDHWGLDAHEFRPERFLEGGEDRHPFAFMPFGGGPRVCPGKAFAVQEMKMALVRVLSEFRVEPRKGETELPVRVKESFTVGPACPVKVVPVLRNKAQ